MNFVDRDRYQAAEDSEPPEAPPLEDPRNPQWMEEPLPAGEPWDETLVPAGKSTDELSWGQWYEACPVFAKAWEMCHQWPLGYSLAAAGNVVALRGLVEVNKFCILESPDPYVIREHHESVAHGGQEKLLEVLPRLYCLAIEGQVLKDLVRGMVSTSVLCQAYKQPVRDLAVKARPTPVPLSVGDHVALDVFHMLRVSSEGVYYDCLILAVDVLSGYTMTVPMTLSGLTGTKAAKRMFTEWA